MRDRFEQARIEMRYRPLACTAELGFRVALRIVERGEIEHVGVASFARWVVRGGRGFIERRGPQRDRGDEAGDQRDAP